MHYIGANSYLFANSTKIIKFKAKDSEPVATPLYLGNVSKDFFVDNTKKTGLNRYISDFSDDYNATAVDDILDIHKYLMKKNDMFFTAINFFSCNAWKCISMNNQEQILNINNN